MAVTFGLYGALLVAGTPYQADHGKRPITALR